VTRQAWRTEPYLWIIQPLAVALFFAFFAPPIASLVLIGVDVVVSIDQISEGPKAIVFLALISVLLSYLYGFIPAAAAGLLVGIVQWRMRRVPWYAALGIGLFVGVGFSIFLRDTFGSDRVAYMRNVFVWITTTFIFWAVVRKWPVPWTADIASPNKAEAK